MQSIQFIYSFINLFISSLYFLMYVNFAFLSIYYASKPPFDTSSFSCQRDFEQSTCLKQSFNSRWLLIPNQFLDFNQINLIKLKLYYPHFNSAFVFDFHILFAHLCIWFHTFAAPYSWHAGKYILFIQLSLFQFSLTFSLNSTLSIQYSINFN